MTPVACPRVILVSSCVVACTVALSAQTPVPSRALTSADYARAERLMSYNVTPLVLHSGVKPMFLADGRFWYRTATDSGNAFVLIDPSTGGRSRCELPECTDRNAETALRRGRSPRRDAPSPD